MKNFRVQEGRHIYEVREIGKCGRIVRSKIFRGQIGRQIWEVREVMKIERSGGLEGFGMRKRRQDPLACN
jgi:hypothetical protein